MTTARFAIRGLARGIAALALASLPAVAQAQCAPALAALNARIATGDVAGMRAALDTLGPAGCNVATQRAAQRQVAGAMARLSQALIAEGRLQEAEALLGSVPALHWAVQSSRADIAMRRGQHEAAARLYNDAIDTMADPDLTEQRPELVPVMTRLAQLAQENMMLAGTLSSAIGARGDPRGVMGLAARGITVELVPAEEDAPAASDSPDEDYSIAEEAAEALSGVYLPVRFEFDSDRLDPSGLAEATALAEFLLNVAPAEITLEGHTDEVGAADYNLDLSRRRAETVGAFLLSRGVTARITLVGKGETEPPELSGAVPYSDEERRSIARRVELVLDDG